jgi:Amt family ammonium transporter
VHISSGVAALVCCLVLGKRTGFPREAMMPHNVVYSLIGTGLLWVGWFGFNAGSAVNAGGLATSAFAATHFSAAAAALSWTFAEWWLKGKPSVLGAASGMVAGLATITPASGFVTIPSAVFIGLVAGLVCYAAVTKLKARFAYDDSLDVFGVHGVGSVIGMLMLGFLASADANAAIASTYQTGGQVVSLAGSGVQFVNQLKAVLFTVVFSGGVSLVLLKLVDKLIGLRVDKEDESLGLDLSQHGERAYNE